MGGEGGGSQGPGGFPPPSGAADQGDDRETRVRWRVRVPLNSGGNGRREDPPHRCVNQEEAGGHSGKGGLPPHL